MIYKGREKVIKLFYDYTTTVFKAKYEAKREKKPQNIKSETNNAKVANSSCTSKSR